MRAAKDMLRREMRDRRDALPPAARAEASAAAAEHLLELPEVARAGTVALFGSIRTEIDTAPAHAALQAKGITLAYPRVVPGTARLAFHAVTDAGEMRRSETLGVPEPSAGAPAVRLEDIRVFIVPGLAFDPFGARVGWGRGHYDQTLAAAPRALRVGYAFDFQIVAAVPAGAGDERMDVLCTESGARAVLEGRPR
jgi:5-formyltetrahydrofolate cyclo-ligase